MKLHVIGSSSKGNCYLLYNDTECLIIEAGIPFKEINRLPFFNTKNVVGCIITHEHGDHAGRINEYITHGIQCYASSGTKEKVGNDRIHNLPTCELLLGSFHIYNFQVEHDAVDPVGFLINHPETGNILFATDTYYLRYTFPELNNILIECNYQREILDENYKAGIINRSRRNRTLLSHMELKTCIDTLLANNLGSVHKVIIIHLSEENSHEKYFIECVKEAIRCDTYAAKPGLNIRLSKEPF